MVTTKMQMAADFIKKLQKMDLAEASLAIERDIGFELATFMTNYAAEVVKNVAKGAPPDAILALMMMGYMIRLNETKPQEADSQATFSQIPGKASA